MSGLLRDHVAAVRAAWRHLAAAPGNFLMNVFVLAAAFLLPFAGLAALNNLRPMTAQLAAQPEISVFLAMATPRDKAVALERDLLRVARAADASARLVFVPREQALVRMKDRSGLSDALTALNLNPLPDAYVVTLPALATASMSSDVERAAKEIAALPGVETVQVDSLWIKRLAALVSLMQTVLTVLAAALGAVVVSVVFNTIRLQVLHQAAEIGVARLVGATDAFLRRPFYYAGALLGIGAGALALGLAALLLQPVNRTVTALAQLYASDFRFTPLDWPASMALVAIAGLLGLVGAALSVHRHLTRSP